MDDSSCYQPTSVHNIDTHSATNPTPTPPPNPIQQTPPTPILIPPKSQPQSPPKFPPTHTSTHTSKPSTSLSNPTRPPNNPIKIFYSDQSSLNDHQSLEFEVVLEEYRNKIFGEGWLDGMGNGGNGGNGKDGDGWGLKKKKEIKNSNQNRNGGNGDNRMKIQRKSDQVEKEEEGQEEMDMDLEKNEEKSTKKQIKIPIRKNSRKNIRAQSLLAKKNTLNIKQQQQSKMPRRRCKNGFRKQMVLFIIEVMLAGPKLFTIQELCYELDKMSSSINWRINYDSHQIIYTPLKNPTPNPTPSPENPQAPKQSLSLNQAHASKLKRRLYEILKILQSLQIIKKLQSPKNYKSKWLLTFDKLDQFHQSLIMKQLLQFRRNRTAAQIEEIIQGVQGKIGEKLGLGKKEWVGVVGVRGREVGSGGGGGVGGFVGVGRGRGVGKGVGEVGVFMVDGGKVWKEGL